MNFSKNKKPSKVLGRNLLMRKEREAYLLKRLTRSPLSLGFFTKRVDDNGGQGCGWPPLLSGSKPCDYP